MNQKKKKGRLVVASNRMPFYKSFDKNGKASWNHATGGLVTALDPVLKGSDGVWVGWDGIAHKKIPKKIKLINTKDMKLNEAMFGPGEGHYSAGIVPLSLEEIDLYYNRLSNGVLWALFHSFFQHSSIDYDAWDTYVKVNQRFADLICDFTDDHDQIWIQDFHLFLVPQFIRQKCPKRKIHFFLHIPFPHVDIFSILPWQNQILDSLLACNSVGFHHKSYQRNCLEAIKIYHRELEAAGKEIPKQKVKTNFFVNPISIDFNYFSDISKSAKTNHIKTEIKQISNAPKLILGVDRLDYSKGIKERLFGIERLLEEKPMLAETFTYHQLAVPSREDVGAYRDLKRQIDEIIGRINGRFSTQTWSPIHYIYRSMPFEELIALYAAADIALVTPLRDGMNLVCKEFVASHSDNDGVLILSKFAGAIAEMKGSIKVNPYDIEDISNALYQALTMPEEERKNRMKKLRRQVKTNNIDAWLERCLNYFNGKTKGKTL